MTNTKSHDKCHVSTTRSKLGNFRITARVLLFLFPVVACTTRQSLAVTHVLHVQSWNRTVLWFHVSPGVMFLRFVHVVECISSSSLFLRMSTPFDSSSPESSSGLVEQMHNFPPESNARFPTSPQWLDTSVIFASQSSTLVSVPLDKSLFLRARMHF